MTCEKFEDLLPAYADGELGAEDRAAVESHLRSCPGCSLLLGCLRTTDASLGAIPDVEPSPELRRRLLAIPSGKPFFGRALDLFLRPSLQPFYAAASIALALFSLYAINPDKAAIDQAVSRGIHRGISRVERLYARAGAVKESVGDFAENVFVSLENIDFFKRAGD
jgi:anti-sigma factor RsiW